MTWSFISRRDFSNYLSIVVSFGMTTKMVTHFLKRHSSFCSSFCNFSFISRHVIHENSGFKSWKPALSLFIALTKFSVSPHFIWSGDKKMSLETRAFEIPILSRDGHEKQSKLEKPPCNSRSIATTFKLPQIFLFQTFIFFHICYMWRTHGYLFPLWSKPVFKLSDEFSWKLSSWAASLEYTK